MTRNLHAHITSHLHSAPPTAPAIPRPHGEGRGGASHRASLSRPLGRGFPSRQPLPPPRGGPGRGFPSRQPHPPLGEGQGGASHRASLSLPLGRVGEGLPLGRVGEGLHLRQSPSVCEGKNRASQKSASSAKSARDKIRRSPICLILRHYSQTFCITLQPALAAQITSSQRACRKTPLQGC